MKKKNMLLTLSSFATSRLQFYALFSLLMLTLLPDLKAQKIYFSDTSNKWVVHYSNMHWLTPDSYHTLAYQDTTIESGAHVYQLLHTVMVREDTALGKVYMKHEVGRINSLGGAYVSDSSEFVIYDYNLTVGDSLVMPIDFLGDTSVHVLDSVTQITINGTVHKVQHFHFSRGFYGPERYRVVEGIGSEWGPFYLSPKHHFEVSFDLNCFHNNGITPAALHDIFPYFSCRQIVGIDEHKSEPFILNSYPNPVHSELTVKTLGDKGVFSLDVLDITGLSHYTSRFSDEHSINTTQWPKGIYLLRVADKHGRCVFRKIQVW